MYMCTMYIQLNKEQLSKRKKNWWALCSARLEKIGIYTAIAIFKCQMYISNIIKLLLFEQIWNYICIHFSWCIEHTIFHKQLSQGNTFWKKNQWDFSSNSFLLAFFCNLFVCKFFASLLILRVFTTNSEHSLPLPTKLYKT